MKIYRKKKNREKGTVSFIVVENPPLIFQEEYCCDCDDYNPKLYNERGAAIRDIVIATVRDSYG